MKVLVGRNVNELYRSGLIYLAAHGERSDSRAGPVVVAPTPVTSVYQRPTERVLLDPRRDANPFFHLFEGLWMLVGRRDAASLNRYVGDFGARFGEPDGTIHDAYGHRWRNALGFDQLEEIIKRLSNNPQDRQCVLQMWDATIPDEEVAWDSAGMNDLLCDWKGRPCNTHIYFRIRGTSHDLHGFQPVLDMTILCRSNDVVWGAYGANAVHFSMLMEYMAGRIGVDVGTMYQVSNNFHGYVEVLDKLGDPTLIPTLNPYNPSREAALTSMPMGTRWDRWDEDLKRFMAWHDDFWEPTETYKARNAENAWFEDVAAPMCIANRFWKQKERTKAWDVAQTIAAGDWRFAALAWMERRIHKDRARISEVRSA